MGKKDFNDIVWNHYFDLVLNYLNHYKNINIKNSFITLDGINYNPNGIRLGDWIKRQHRYYMNKKESMKKERIEKLESINISSLKSAYDVNWNLGFQLLKKYVLWYYV